MQINQKILTHLFFPIPLNQNHFLMHNLSSNYFQFENIMVTSPASRSRGSDCNKWDQSQEKFLNRYIYTAPFRNYWLLAKMISQTAQVKKIVEKLQNFKTFRQRNFCFQIHTIEWGKCNLTQAKQIPRWIKY